jgi:serine protease inhibitor
MAMVRYFLSIPLLLGFAGMLNAEDRVVAGMNSFAASSYRELAGPDNLIVSPFSISTALSMVLDGARGGTATEISKVLGQHYPDRGYHAALAALVEELTKSGNIGANQLLSANGLWVQSGFRIQSDFENTIRQYYGAPVRGLDFLSNPNAARAAINSWTEQQTKGKIRELFGPGSLDGSTRLVLTSAIYFHGRWQAVFRTSETHPASFHLGAGGTVQASFMHQTGTFGYADTPALQVLEMKYAGTPLAFDILLPKNVDGLSAVEHSLTAGDLSGWLGSLRNRPVEVAVPRFRAESKFSLRETLARMGMSSAFGASADFSGIDDRRDLQLSDVLHKAYADVSEEGTEAAAATGGAVRLVAMMQPPSTVFRADHPFAFVIRDTRSQVILFTGRLIEPKPAGHP